MKSPQKVWEKLAFDFLDNKEIFRYPGIKKYLTGLYRDTMAVFLVSIFVSKKRKQIFLKFLNTFVFKPEVNPEIYHFLWEHFNEIQKIVKYCASREDVLKDIQILGDIHGIHNTKLLLVGNDDNKKVFIGNHHTSDNQIINLFKFLTESKEYFSPKYHTQKEGMFRSFLSYTNNFHSWKEIANFYKKFWGKSAFLLALRAIDLHYENILISDNYPYFFDFECLFSPFINDYPYSIFISWIIDDQTTWESFWPLFWWRDIRKSYLTPYIINYGKYPSIQRTVPSKYKKIHIPQSENITLNPYIFKEEFLNGFLSMKKKILKNKNEIFTTIHKHKMYNRILFRPTRVYFALIKEMIMKFSLSEKFDNNQFLQEKLNILPLFTPITNKEALIQEEIQQLKKGIIPYFYSEIHQKEVFNSENTYICTLTSSCEQEFLDHLSNLETFYLKTEEEINQSFTTPNKKI